MSWKRRRGRVKNEKQRNGNMFRMKRIDKEKERGRGGDVSRIGRMEDYIEESKRMKG